jgi:hypothetical protein
MRVLDYLLVCVATRWLDSPLVLTCTNNTPPLNLIYSEPHPFAPSFLSRPLPSAGGAPSLVDQSLCAQVPRYVRFLPTSDTATVAQDAVVADAAAVEPNSRPPNTIAHLRGFIFYCHLYLSPLPHGLFNPRRRTRLRLSLLMRMARRCCHVHVRDAYGNNELWCPRKSSYRYNVCGGACASESTSFHRHCQKLLISSKGASLLWALTSSTTSYLSHATCS